MFYRALSFMIVTGMPIVLQGCVPVAVVGAGAFVGSSAVEERGVGGVVSDTGIRSGINAAWLDYDPKISEMVELSVREGKVLLTGQVDNMQTQIDAVRLAWTVGGVREVIDETKLGEGGGFSGYAGDSWITAKLKTSLVFEDDIYSINYNIKTVDGIVFLMGISQSQEENDRVIEIARSISGVKDVVNYVRSKDDVLLLVPASQAGGMQAQPESYGQAVQPIPPSQPAADLEYKVSGFPAPLAQ